MVQRDSCSTVIFIDTIPHSIVLCERNVHYQLRKYQRRLNQILFMGKLKLLAKTEPVVEWLVDTKRRSSNYVGMELVISKYAIINLKQRKRLKTMGHRVLKPRENEIPGYSLVQLLWDDSAGQYPT